MEFPPNSQTAKSTAAPEDKKIKRVTSSEPKRRKKSLGKQFRETFVGGDAKTAMHYVVFGVLLPAAKDALVDAGSQGIERLIFGDSRPRRGPGHSGPMGHISYNRMSGPSRPAQTGRSLSQHARSRHDFDEIVLSSLTEAEDVIDRLFDLISRYESASVADLYELTGLKSSHTDHKWGWTDLRGASVSRLRNSGYLLDLPEPEPFR